MNFIINILVAANKAYKNAVVRFAAFIKNNTGDKFSTKNIERTTNIVAICVTILLFNKFPVLFGNIIAIAAVIAVVVALMAALFENMFTMAFEHVVEKSQGTAV